MQFNNVPCSKRTVQNILQVHDIESTNVSLTMSDYTYTSHVTSTCDHSNVTNIKRHKLGDLVLLYVKLDGVIRLD